MARHWNRASAREKALLMPTSSRSFSSSPSPEDKNHHQRHNAAPHRLDTPDLVQNSPTLPPPLATPDTPGPASRAGLTAGEPVQLDDALVAGQTQLLQHVHAGDGRAAAAAHRAEQHHPHVVRARADDLVHVHRAGTLSGGGGG